MGRAPAARETRPRTATSVEDALQHTGYRMERSLDVEPPPEGVAAIVEARMGIRLDRARAESWLAADDRNRMRPVWVVVGSTLPAGAPASTLVAVIDAEKRRLVEVQALTGVTWAPT